MDMAKVKLTQLSQHGKLLQRYGARIQISGRRDLLRKDVLEVADRAVEMTKDNGNSVLNICCPYTSRDEMTTAIRETVREYSQPLRPTPRRGFSETRISQTIRSKHLNEIAEEQASNGAVSAPESIANDADDTELSDRSVASSADRQAPSSQTSAPSSPVHKPIKQNIQYPDPENITSKTISDHTYTAGTPPLDLLIRTSGVQRLSDFMLWQCHENTEIVFLDCLWPEFDLWQFLPVLVEWQWKNRQSEEPVAASSRTVKAA